MNPDGLELVLRADDLASLMAELGTKETAKKPANKPHAVAVARGHRWLALLEDGKYQSIDDLANALKVDRAYVSRLLNLTMLRPEHIAAILGCGEMFEASIRELALSVPLDWLSQDDLGGFAQSSSGSWVKAPSIAKRSGAGDGGCYSSTAKSCAESTSSHGLAVLAVLFIDDVYPRRSAWELDSEVLRNPL